MADRTCPFFQGLVFDGGVAQLFRDAREHAALHEDRHIVTGQTTLRNVLAQVLTLPLAVGVVTGSALGARVEVLVQIWAALGGKKKGLVAFRARRKVLVVPQKVTDPAFVRIVAGYAEFLARRMSQVPFRGVPFRISVTLEAH
jgi:hypothetical protein